MKRRQNAVAATKTVNAFANGSCTKGSGEPLTAECKEPVPINARSSSSALARRSTGPRTPQGKQRSRLNALKHGLFADSILLIGESPAEFQALLNGFRESIQPHGMLEDLEVEKLATLFWRLRRLLRAERAKVEKRYVLELPKDCRFQSNEGVLQALQEWADKKGLLSLPPSLGFINTAIGGLEKLRRLIEKRGLDRDADYEILQTLYGEWHSEPTDRLPRIYLSVEKLVENEVAKDANRPSTTPKERQRIVVDAIEKEISTLNELRQLADQHMRLKMDLADIPDEDDLDRLLRYEVHLNREIERTQNRIERLQRARMGQPVPPSMRLEVS